jgi:DNA repair exonuclease SbcCD ATPase subunit
MLIEEIGIRGFKSYGNNEQVLKLNTQKGELILLVGNNGSGKSSLLDSFDYVLYGKVRGKKKRWSTLSTLPNRINGELLNRIKFKSQGTEVEVKRGISPNTLELYENGVLNDRAGKANIDEKIEKYIGMDIETFKSFISMSINDFKNFISLSTEEKQLLLDKLFNLEVINILNSILKELNKNNKIRMASLDSEISTLNESIQSIQRSVDKAIDKEKENTQSEIDEIKSQMESKKSDYATLKEKVDKIKVKDSELSSELEKEKRQYIIIQTEIKGVQKDVDLYDSGKCPTCKTDFDSEHFVSLRSTLIEKKQSLESHKLEIENNIKAVKERQQKLQTISEVATKSFNDITYFLKNCKAQIEKLQSKQQRENGKSSENVQEFKSTIKELQTKKNLSSDNISGCKDKELYYKELGKIFSEDGVKKSIISGIIKPINFFISENIKKMGLHFEVSLDETFTAEIKHLGNNIEHDTLSTGEQKKINVAILIAYLKLIRTKKHINVLFLDEVFSSIDLEGISDILSLLKSFSNEYNINIFVVHHALLNHENFDRIISIHKEIFSSIEELNFENININGEEYTYQV